MGYAAFSRKYISRAFPGVEEAPERAPAVEAMRKGRIVHRASLGQFPIFCNKLSSEPLPFGGLNPKAANSLKQIALGFTRLQIRFDGTAIGSKNPMSENFSRQG
jgi:hypothetical protein